jgi:hypothetical protein
MAELAFATVASYVGHQGDGAGQHAAVRVESAADREREVGVRAGSPYRSAAEKITRLLSSPER